MEEVMIPKYQVWDGERMHKVKSINLSESMPGGIHHVVVRKGEHGVDTLFQSVHGVPDGEFDYDLKLRQFTGLLDKNGKEIYEGDVVKGIRDSHWHGGKDRVSGKVYFDSNNLSFRVDGMGGGDIHNIEDLEVIGNIYENSELLQD